MAYDDLPPPSPYAGDWSVGALLGSIGVIYIGEVTVDQARDLVNQGWNVVGQPLPPVVASAEPAPAPAPEPAPAPAPQPAPTPFPDTPPANDPVVEPRTPITPPELTPQPEPTLPPQPIFEPTPEPTPPGLDAPKLPPLPPIFEGGGPIIVAVGGLLWPSEIGPEPDVREQRIPSIDIPPPRIDFPEPELNLPEPETLPFPYPQAPDVVVVSAPAPKRAPTPRASPFPLSNIGVEPWPILFPTPARNRSPAPQPTPNSPPPSPQPRPISPPLPRTPPTVQLPSPSSPPTADVPRLPTPLTTTQDAGLGSEPAGETCETPSEQRERRARQRENCRKVIRVKVKAHYRKLCVSEFVEHEAKKLRKKLVKKYVTKPAGKLGRDAADWLLKKTGLTPYSEQAKDIKKRVSDLTKKQKRYRVEIPGTHGEFDPVDLIPKGKP